MNEETAFVLIGRGSPAVEVSWQELKHCQVGDRWESLDGFDDGDSHNEIATVIYKGQDGCAVLFRTWGLSPRIYVHEDLVWFDFSSGTVTSIGRPAPDR